MSRAAIIVAIIITGISSPSLAASDEEIGNLMSGAFRCSTYAGMFHDQKEQQRLFQIGLKAAREGAKALRSDPKFSEMAGDFMPSVDFMAGILWDTETTKAYDEIVKYDDYGLPREHWLNPDEAKTHAELRYRQSNCSLIK